MRAANRVSLLFALLLLGVFSTVPTTTASLLPPKHQPLHRRFLHQHNLDHNRHLLQSCSSCPATATASATCKAASSTLLNTIRADLISKCGSSAFNPSRCCELYASSNWNTYAACACSDTIAGLSAFVDGPSVMAACGCGPSISSTTTTTNTPTTTPNFIGRVTSSNQSGSTSSSIDMATVYQSISFSNGGGGGGTGGGGSGTSSGGSSGSGTSGTGTSTGNIGSTTTP